MPQQLSVLGFDGVRLDGLTEHVLTTLVQPAIDKGRAAGRAVLTALAGGSPRAAQLRCELRIGTTTGPPAARLSPNVFLIHKVVNEAYARRS